MRITQFDVKVLIASTFVVLSMSFVFPALGLAGGSGVSYQDMPSFDVDSDRFDVVGDFPRRPGTPTTGYLYWQQELLGDSDNQVFLDGGESSGVELGTLYEDSNDTARVIITNWDSGTQQNQTSVYLNESGTESVDVYDYQIRFEVVEWTDTSNGADYSVQYNLNDQPASDSWYNRIPVIGGAIPSTEHVAGILSWIGSVIYWIAGSGYELIVNTIAVIIDVAAFVLGFVSWIYSSYTGIVTAGATPAWVNAFLAIPGMLMLATWGKLVAVLISIVWIG